jgi:large subunit ribosomal protein L22
MATATDNRREVRALAKWVRISPRKARLVAEHIRGRTVPEARTILAFTPRAAAREVEKVLRSAVANAEANHNLAGDELYVATATVDEGVTLKRWRPQARGRAHRIRKRTCHILISLAPLDDVTIAVQPPAPPEPEPEPEHEPEHEPEPEAAEEQPEAVDEVEDEAGSTEAAAAEPEPEPEPKPRRLRRRRAAQPEPEAEAAETEEETDTDAALEAEGEPEAEADASSEEPEREES